MERSCKKNPACQTALTGLKILMDLIILNLNLGIAYKDGYCGFVAGTVGKNDRIAIFPIAGATSFEPLLKPADR